jgi:hypothetical protein
LAKRRSSISSCREHHGHNSRAADAKVLDAEQYQPQHGCEFIGNSSACVTSNYYP